MGVVTLPNTLADHTVPAAASFNANFNTIYNEFNGGIDNANIANDAAIAESKLDFDSVSGHSHNGSDSKLISVNRAFAWFEGGTLVAGTNRGPRYVAPQNLTIKKIWLIVRTAPTGAAIIVDINKNGSTIWTNQANRATIAIGSTSGNTTSFDITSLVPGDYLDLDIDQIGSTVSGEDLTVILETSQP